MICAPEEVYKQKMQQEVKKKRCAPLQQDF